MDFRFKHFVPKDPDQCGSMLLPLAVVKALVIRDEEGREWLMPSAPSIYVERGGWYSDQYGGWVEVKWRRPQLLSRKKYDKIIAAPTKPPWIATISKVAAIRNRLLTGKYRYPVVAVHVFLLVFLPVALFGTVNNWWLTVGLAVFVTAAATCLVWLEDKYPELRRYRR